MERAEVDRRQSVGCGVVYDDAASRRDTRICLKWRNRQKVHIFFCDHHTSITSNDKLTATKDSLDSRPMADKT